VADGIDIFEWYQAKVNAGEYPKSGFYERFVTAKSQKIVDMTEEVEDRRNVGRFPYEVKEGTKYYGVKEKHRGGMRYSESILSSIGGKVCAIGTSANPMYKTAMENLRNVSEKEKHVYNKDKIFDRDFSVESGIFENPKSLDLRWLQNLGLEQAITFKIRGFAGFPVKKIVKSIGERKSFIFENVVDGFSIRTDGKGIVISSRNPLAKEAIRETMDVKDPEKRIREFLRNLAMRDYSVTKIGWQEVDLNPLYDAILMTKNPLYLKASSTGGGWMVARLWRDENGRVALKSDDGKFAELEQYVQELAQRSFDICKKRLEHLIDAHAAKMVVDNEKKILKKCEKRLRDGNFSGMLLSEYFYSVPNLIIEAEIAGEKVDGRRVEFRFICQKNLIDGEETAQVPFGIFAYTKVSGGNQEVSANISLGGHGEPVVDTLRGIYRQKLPVSEEVLCGIAEDEYARLGDKCRKFADLVYEKSGNFDFAIDIIPVFNKETGALDFYFLEMNRNYGYTALPQVSKVDAERITNVKELNQIMKAISDLGYRNPREALEAIEKDPQALKILKFGMKKTMQLGPQEKMFVDMFDAHADIVKKNLGGGMAQKRGAALVIARTLNTLKAQK